MTNQALLAVESRGKRIFRGTVFNAIILGLISFTQPGIWVALNNLGAGGQALPYVVNTANSITFVIMVFTAPLFGVLANRYGAKWVIAFGCLGYAPYSAALYCNSVFGTQWFMIFGAVTCGFSAAALWTAEAAIGVGYPELYRRGTLIGVWLGLNKIGTFIGGAIQLGMNYSIDTTGSIMPDTYLVLVGLQCAGLPLSLLLATPKTLIRKDGTKPLFEKTTIRAGLRILVQTFKRKEILYLLPIFITNQWGQTYNGVFLSTFFTVRARALCAFIAGIIGFLTDVIFGYLLDRGYFRLSVRAKASWAFLFVGYTVAWILSLVVQTRFDRENAVVDYTSSEFSIGAAAYLVWRIPYEAANTWTYWILAQYNSDVRYLAITTGILRSCESFGSAISYGVGAAKSSKLLYQLVVSVAVFYASAPFAAASSWLIKDQNELNMHDTDVSTISSNERKNDYTVTTEAANGVEDSP